MWDTVTGALAVSSSTCPSNSSPMHMYVYKETEEAGEEGEEEGEGGEEALA